MSLQTKLVLSTLTVGTVGGVGYLGSTYFTNKDEQTIKDTPKPKLSKLISDKYDFILLSTAKEDATNKDQSIWNTNWDSYKKNNKGKNTGEDPFKLDGWVPERDDLNLVEKLKEKCKELAEDNDPTLYENVTKYCARGVTFEEQATKDGLTNLDTSTTNKHSKIWDSRNEKKADFTNDFEKLKITNTEDANKIKEGCKTAKSHNKQIEDYSEIYKAYKKICTLQPEDPRST